MPARMVEGIRLRKGTPTTEHLKLVLSVIDGPRFHEGANASGTMAEPSDSNSLELRIAFHNAVSRFQDWTADVAEPKVKLRGRFCPISEICQEVANLSDPLPEAILSILYNETQAGDDMLTLKMDETYRGAGRHLRRLIENRKHGRRREPRS